MRTARESDFFFASVRSAFSFARLTTVALVQCSRRRRGVSVFFPSRYNPNMMSRCPSIEGRWRARVSVAQLLVRRASRRGPWRSIRDGGDQLFDI